VLRIYSLVGLGLVPAQLTPLKIRGVRRVMKSTIAAEHASRNVMPIEITPLLIPPYCKGG
jgi:hypothetical protein